MLSVKVEQPVNVKFLAKLGKSTTETYNLLMETRMNICADILQNTENDPNFLGNVMNNGIFQYDLETKRQSMRTPSPTKARKNKSNFKQ
jgi:hypothetical protein